MRGRRRRVRLDAWGRAGGYVHGDRDASDTARLSLGSRRLRRRPGSAWTATTTMSTKPSIAMGQSDGWLVASPGPPACGDWRTDSQRPDTRPGCCAESLATSMGTKLVPGEIQSSLPKQLQHAATPPSPPVAYHAQLRTSDVGAAWGGPRSVGSPGRRGGQRLRGRTLGPICWSGMRGVSLFLWGSVGWTQSWTCVEVSDCCFRTVPVSPSVVSRLVPTIGVRPVGLSTNAGDAGPGGCAGKRGRFGEAWEAAETTLGASPGQSGQKRGREQGSVLLPSACTTAPWLPMDVALISLPPSEQRAMERVEHAQRSVQMALTLPDGIR